MTARNPSLEPCHHGIENRASKAVSTPQTILAKPLFLSRYLAMFDSGQVSKSAFAFAQCKTGIAFCQFLIGYEMPFAGERTLRAKTCRLSGRYHSSFSNETPKTSHIFIQQAAGRVISNETAGNAILEQSMAAAGGIEPNEKCSPYKAFFIIAPGHLFTDFQ
jgi:hypothetical protein